jgi:hypothetical protein
MVLLQGIFHANVLVALPLRGVLLPLLFLVQEAVLLSLLAVLWDQGLRMLHHPLQPLTTGRHQRQRKKPMANRNRKNTEE